MLLLSFCNFLKVHKYSGCCIRLSKKCGENTRWMSIQEKYKHNREKHRKQIDTQEQKYPQLT